ncbi:MAG: ATP-binding protein [Acidobacteriia bacterium]|nr:ATP-binding protein [Terriglobia bacterium]
MIPGIQASELHAGRDIRVEQHVEVAPPTATALHQLPPPPGDFTGRKREIDEILSRIEKGTVISGLQGMGGVGKTALALVLAERLTERYRDAQFYLDLKGTSPQPLTPAQAMAHVIRAYSPEAKLPEEEAQLSPLYHPVLHGHCAILLMDSARDAAQVMPLLPPAGCLLLVTSRWHFTLPGLEARSLDTLSPAEARKLLLTIACRSAAAVGEPSGLPRERGALPTADARTRAIIAHADEIARLCDYLPLALRAAASALKAKGDLDPADYTRWLNDARRRLELQDPTKNQSVEASLALSYDLLGPDLQRRFARLAAFPETFWVDGAAAVWEMGLDPARETLGELVTHSLLEWNEAARRYKLHDLVRDFAHARLTSVEGIEAERRHAAHCLSVLWETDRLYKQGGNAVKQAVDLFDREWANIQAGQARAASRAGEDERAARLCSAYPDAGVYCLALRQHPRERIGGWRRR